jgi:hypothetical protein
VDVYTVSRKTCNQAFSSINVSNVILTGAVTCVGQRDGTFGVNGDSTWIEPYDSYFIHTLP